MLKIVGDINLTDGFFDVGYGIGSKLKSGFDPFGRINRHQGDCWIGNFEGVTSEYSELSGVASRQFRIEPQYLKHIVHFEFYGLANNHVMQHGADAYQRTNEVLTSFGCRCFGSRSNRTVRFEHQGRKVSITGFSQRIDRFSSNPSYWYNPEYKEIEVELDSIPRDTFKIVYVHWGNEFINRPSSQQKRFAHWLVDAGADLVIGMHPHVLQGYEVYNEKYIFYSLGNFVFDRPWTPTRFGAVVSLDFSKDTLRPVVDYTIICDDGAPVIINKDDVPLNLRFSYLNMLIDNDDNSEEYHSDIIRYYRQYRKANRLNVVKKMIRHPELMAYLMKDFINRRLKSI